MRYPQRPARGKRLGKKHAGGIHQGDALRSPRHLQKIPRRKRAQKYTPWQGGAFGGSLEFESDKGRFRIERFFGAKESDDSFALYDLSSNKPTDVYTESLGEELFGIDADGFERTVYLSQRLTPQKGENTTVIPSASKKTA